MPKQYHLKNQGGYILVGYVYKPPVIEILPAARPINGLMSSAFAIASGMAGLEVCSRTEEPKGL